MKKYNTLQGFFDDLDDDKRSQVSALRDLILSTDPRLEEHIKWNAPSYSLNGEDRVTFNLVNKQGLVTLVLHMGATRKEDRKGEPVMRDKTGLIDWISDIRGVMTFTSTEEIASQKTLLKQIIKDWLLIPSTT